MLITHQFLLIIVILFQQLISDDAAKSFDMLKNKSVKAVFLMVPEFNSTAFESCLKMCAANVKCVAVGVRGNLSKAGETFTCKLSAIPSKYFLTPFLTGSFFTDDNTENVFYLSGGSGAVSPPEPQLFYSLDSGQRGAPLATNFVKSNTQTTSYTVAFDSPANFSCKLMEVNYLRVPNSLPLPDYSANIGTFMIGDRVTVAGWFLSMSVPYVHFPLFETYDSARSTIHLALTLTYSLSNLYLVAYPSASGNVTLSAAFPLNQWHHIAATKTGSNATFYVNGTRVGSVNMVPFGAGNTAAILQIGRRYLPGYGFDGYLLDGCVAHLAIFNDTLNSNQLRDLAALLWTQ